MIAGATKLRKYLRDTDELIVCPGVYDGLSARIAMQLGFRALYMVCILSLSSTSTFSAHTDLVDRCGNNRL
jgi:2-methylisocitrate lyase-like PEP mutase family enzyme